MSSKSLYNSMTFIITMILTFVSPIVGEVPTTINYQGLLTDSGGDPVADGSYSVTFTIYDANVSGNSKWIETQSVTTSLGLFSVLLGAVNPILDSVFNQPDRYLGIQVESDPELTPRARLTSAPYSQRIATIDGSSGGVIKSSLFFSDSLTLNDDPMIYLFESAPTTPISREIFTRAPFWDQYGLSYHYISSGLEYFEFKNGPTVMSIHMASQRVGIGTAAPDYTLDVSGTLHADGVALGFQPTRSGNNSTVGGGSLNTASANWATVSGGIQNTASGQNSVTPGGELNVALGDYSFAAGRRAKANHLGSFVWGDATNADVTSSIDNEFVARASGGFTLYSDVGMTTGAHLAAGGGSWASVSDRNVKENIRPVEGDEILEKISQLEISRWNYETQDPSIEHIGPMAQDFYELFGVGDNNTSITTIDPDGISLAAIKALIEKNNDLESEISELKRLVKELIEAK